jgi:hypothetical protein
MNRYEIQVRMVNEWDNVWHDNGQLVQFNDYDSAYESLNDYLDSVESFDISDFRIVKA